MAICFFMFFLLLLLGHEAFASKRFLLYGVRVRDNLILYI